MAEKTKAFDFAPNVPVTVEFSFDSPKTGESDGRTWHLYGCRREGKTASFFAPDGLQDALTNAKVKKGTKAVITKVIEEGQKSPKWCVEIDGIFYGEGAAGRTHQPTRAIVEQTTPGDLVNTWWSLWDMMYEQAEKRNFPLPVEQLREANTSVFIRAAGNGNYIYNRQPEKNELEEEVKEALAKAKADVPYADVPPPNENDELPF